MSKQHGDHNMTIDEAGILPDASGFFTASLPLPNDHWLYSTTPDGFTGPPPMPLRMGTADPRRQAFNEAVRAAAQYAVRASTRCGKDDDFDPDALVQNMVVGLLGYHTPDGLDEEAWGNPSPIPPAFA
jgi:hypothetical protein